jgi:hypothetical protein
MSSKKRLVAANQLRGLILFAVGALRIGLNHGFLLYVVKIAARL